jgi:hypothetical protein
MANRYWVGGTGTWNTTSTTNWSATSGGASGASVPTVADSVFFDQAGTYTVTMTGALACLDITVSAGTVTFATGTTPTLNVRGSASLIVGTVWSSTGTITFSSTTTGRTIDFGNSSLTCNFVFNGIGGGWTLSRNLSTTGTITLTNGTFSTGSGPSYNLTTSQITSSGSGTFTLNLNASTITITSSIQPWYTVLTTLTLNAGTSQITFSGNGGDVTTGSVQTFYNVSFTGSTSAVPSTIDKNIFNNLTFPKPFSGSNVYELGSLTINGTLSFSAGNGRVMLTGPGRLASTLTINAVSGFSDIDFKNIYVIGAAAPLSGTRIGNAGNVRGVSTSTPKTVYWNLPAGGDWCSTTSPGWALSSGGAVSKDNFPLPQDTAIIENTGLNSGATITLNSWSTVEDSYIGTIDMSTRSLPMTLAGNTENRVYGDWKFSSSVTNSFTGALYFSATQKDQYITSAGKSFSSKIVIDIYEGSLKPLDAFNQASINDFEMRTGTFDTNDMTVSISTLTTSSTTTYGGSPIAIFLRSSLFTVKNNVTLDFAQNLTIDAGTSTLISSAGNAFLNLGGFTYNNISFTSSGTSNTTTISGNNTFKDFSCTAPASAGYMLFSFSGNQTITGTLTCAGATAVRRIFLFSDTIGTQRTLTVNSISANDCDFRDISLAGAASGASPTRASDCGGNSGITFPAPKTVYWNLAGAQNWGATGWATSSGGSPAVNNFPLAQDTAVFDNTGSVTGTITINVSWNIGTFDSSTRTSAMTLTVSAAQNPSVYGDWKFGTGVTLTSATGTINFSKNGTSTITSNGVQFGCPVTVNHPSGTVQLADAISLNSARTLTLTAGTFDAVTYNVTTGVFSSASGATTKMGTGTWTLSSTGTVWTGAGTNIASTSTIVLSSTSTSPRAFNGGGLYYNKLTIGGTTGTSELVISGANTFGELASTKTVAHTIVFPNAATQTIGKWAVTGTVGNVVTVRTSVLGSAFTLSISGPANSGINYLSVRDCTVSSTSPGEFYVGLNSTNVSGNSGSIFFTATPAPRILYWVGGSGNWSSTTKWSTSSGGGSGAAIPTSLDAVNFDSLSNATAYTAAVDVFARCASFTMAGPASGNVTFSGTSGIAFHGNVSFAATGITRTYTGNMSLAGNSSYTFTTNGLTLGSATTVTGIGATWTLGFALNIGGSAFTVTYGSFSTSASNYALTAGSFSSDNSNVRSVSWNGSSLTLSSSATLLMATTTNLTFDAGTSTISCSSASSTFNGGGLTFNNVSFTSAAATGITITGANTFNTLSFAGRTNVGIGTVTFSANQTITTLTLNAGTASAYRTFLASNTINTERTLSVGALTAGAADVDFRDIAITGAAAPLTGTRFGDCKGNSGITFDAAKTVYYRQTGSANWGATGSGSWTFSSGAPLDPTQFPLAQDTAVFTTFPSSGTTTTINANYNIGTINMSGRTGNTMTLATSTNTPTIYGNWINGTGITLSGSGLLTFAGRASQTITSAGKSFTQALRVNSKNGTVSLQDALVATSTTGLTLISGTFDAQIYNVTLSGDLEGTSSEVRALNFGSGTWTLSGGSATGINLGSADVNNLTISGSGTISVANNTTFCQIHLYGKDFSNITFNAAGSRGFQLISSLPVTVKNITNTYSATGATSIAIGTAGVFTFKSFTATGAAGRVLTLTGGGNNGPTSIVLDDNVASGIDYLSILGLRAYPSQNAWYAGANSTNLGSLGWQFQNIPVNYGKFFLMFG